MASGSPAFSKQVYWLQFYKGNTNTHSSRSEGDATAERVVEWYRDHGYNFLMLTDHSYLSVPGEFSQLETDHFLVAPAMEVSHTAKKSRWETWNRLIPVHVNAFCASQLVPPKTVETVRDGLVDAINAVTKQRGAVAQINHPNYKYAVTAEDILATSGARLIEVASQHPFAMNAGDSNHPSVETIWDAVLSAGKVLFGTASDDMYDLERNPGYPPRRPGKGWVQVAAPLLSSQSLCDALAAGDFYSSTGVEIISIRTDRGLLQIQLFDDGRDPLDFKTEFIGRGGRVLSVVQGLNPVYVLKGDEMYVRARVSTSDDLNAWVQPFYVRSN